MKKFWVVLLKILIVASIIGIIIFVGIAIFNNQNIAYEAYNYVYSTRQKTDFTTLQNKMANKTEYKGVTENSDPYARYLNSGITQLNLGIDYFLDYLSVEDALTKGEQDNLINLYKQYVNNFKQTSVAYDDYQLAYNEAKTQYLHDHEASGYAFTNLNAKTVFLIKLYANTFDVGNKFFRSLVEVVNKYTLSNNSNFTYTAQKYIIQTSFVDSTINYVLDNMDKKAIGAYEINITNNPTISLYYSYLSTANNFSDDDKITNQSFCNFVNNLNSLNIFDWAGNYQKYIASLPEVKKQIAISARDFFEQEF